MCIRDRIDLSAQFGNDSVEEIRSALEEGVEEASRKGLTEKGRVCLRRILDENVKVFGIKLGTSPPADIKPFEVQLKQNAPPVRASQRRYGPVQQSFIEATITNLEKIGTVYRNPYAKWASPALAVPKPDTSQLRFTVDLRAVNGMTVIVQSGMPHLESHLQQCSKSRCFSNLDFCHGFWQVPLAKES